LGAQGKRSLTSSLGRRWIDEAQLNKYTVDAATDGDGKVLEDAEDWSLKYLMASCLDFAKEMTALQHIGS
jgi:hypothetical protein